MQVRARRSLLRCNMELPASLSTDDPSHAQTIFQVNFAAVIPTALSFSVRMSCPEAVASFVYRCSVLPASVLPLPDDVQEN